MPVSDEFLNAGLAITGHFEDAQDPLGAVSGNFDGQGVSLGVLQWNIGSGSLQPIVKTLGQAAVTSTMPQFGNDLWNACNTTIAQGLAIVRAWQPQNKLPPGPFNECKAFVKSKPFQDQQLVVARNVGDKAWDLAVDWATQLGGPPPTKKQFCWFYDVLTQNGSLKTVTLGTVQNFIANHGGDGADDLICNWLAAWDGVGAADAHKNAEKWRGSIWPSDNVLFVASYLRSLDANPTWRADVMNRKGTVATGSGWVHTELHDVTPITG